MTYEETKTAHPDLARLMGRLQDAYDEKNPGAAGDFVKGCFAADGTVLIIGTESGEWFEGTEEVTRLFYWDWELWGKVDFGFPSRCWVRFGDFSAQIASEGRCVMVMDSETVAGEYVSRDIPAILGLPCPDSQKVRELMRTSAHLHSQLQYGETCTWPLRFSAAAEKFEGSWKFVHMHFSIPSLSLPAVRGEAPFFTAGENHPFLRDIPS